MNELTERECKIIGYGTYTDKNTQDKMLRIIIAVRSNKENYKGLMIPRPLFLKHTQELENNLNLAIEDKNIKTYYETTEDIISGKTEITRLIINK